MQENFLHTSVKCCTSAGKFPAHTLKIWIFLSSAGNMFPTLQLPNTGALSHWFSFLISFGTCKNTTTLEGGEQVFSIFQKTWRLGNSDLHTVMFTHLYSAFLDNNDT